jgi:hypothetical protein
MRTRSLPAAGLVALTVLMLGCREASEREEAVIPPSAIPAAQDMRPGTETAAPGGVAQPGMDPVQDTVVREQQPVEPLTPVTPDTVR